MGRPKKNTTEVVEKVNQTNNIEEDVRSLLKDIRKEFGEESILTFDSSTALSLPRVSSGILPLDYILGGGYALGRIVEIFGPESSGKTTITLKAIASMQKEGKICAFIDAEHAFDPVYAKNLGINLNTLLYTAPDNGEQALDIAEELIRSGKIGLVVVDSVAALVPKKEIDGEMGDANVGLHARLMSQAMRKLTGIVNKSNCVLIFINQIREKVGIMYGSPETTTGGRALKFYASIRLDVRKKQTITEGTESVANHVRVKTVKNKTYPPLKECEFDIIFGKGPDEEGSLIDSAINMELIDKAGAWYTLADGSRFQGANKLKEFFKTEQGKLVFEDLKKKIAEKFKETTNSSEEMNIDEDNEEKFEEESVVEPTTVTGIE